MDQKTFEFQNGTVTVHGWDRWPVKRLVPLLERYIARTKLREDGKDAA